MQPTRRKRVCIAILWCSAVLGLSQNLCATSGTEGAAFLDIPVGAGPAALGSAYSSLATDAYAPIYNPAGLGFVTSPEVAGQHLSYLQSANYEFGSVVIPFNTLRSALGFSVQYLGSGDITETDPSGNTFGNFSVYYAAYSLSYGQKITDKFSLGFTGKVINAKIADTSANAYAGDAGALYKVTDKLQLAATVTNAGSKLTFSDQSDSLPLAYHVAAAYQPKNHFLFIVEGVQAQNGPTDGRFGVQWRPLEVVSLRAGYRTDTTKELSALAGFSTGIGLHLWGQEFAYAWLPYGDLGDTQYFSLLLKFGAKDEEKRNLIQYQTIKQHRTVQGEPSRDANANDPEYRQLMQLLDNGAPTTLKSAQNKDPQP